uniref:Lipoprotein n=1 Tax=Parascaris univalens TaxID=6257 RepID=A0A915CJY5_PARUN
MVITCAIPLCLGVFLFAGCGGTLKSRVVEKNE